MMWYYSLQECGIIYCWGGFLNIKKQSEYSLLTDDHLAVLAQNGEEGAFNALAARYLKLKPSKAPSSYLDAEDFLQESMFGFMNAVRTFNADKGVPFKAYASVCMRNSVKSAAGGLGFDVPVDNDMEALLGIQTDEDPLDKIIDGERLGEVLQQCEVSLSQVEKTVVFLKAGGLSYDEIGKKLGMGAKAVDNAVQRARKKLKSL